MLGQTEEYRHTNPEHRQYAKESVCPEVIIIFHFQAGRSSREIERQGLGSEGRIMTASTHRILQ